MKNNSGLIVRSGSLLFVSIKRSMAVSCSVKVVLWILITIVGMIILAYSLLLTIVEVSDEAFIRGVNKAFKTFCSTVFPIKYLYPVTLPATNGVYEQQLAIALSNICNAADAGNCPNAAIPLPPPYSGRLELLADAPYSGKPTIYGYIFWNATDATIVFTGTQFVSQWKSDLDFAQVAPTALNGYTPGILVHEGFYDIYKLLKPLISNWWNNSTVSNLFITGHSLGGALSTLCAFDFSGFPKNLIHYSFAAPRSGNSLYAATFDSRVPDSIRVNNTEDIVPAVPFATTGKWNYEQTGGNAPFTVSLDSMADNHNEAYQKYLPVCPQNVACNSS